jgi:hypothetical protein
MALRRIPETAVAAPVVEWLQDLDWDVYREVATGGQRPDIVAVRGPLIWVVEAKTSMSLQLLDQVVWWIDKAHFVSVAIPFGKSVHSRFVARYLRDLGIGEFAVRGDGGKDTPFHAEDRIGPVFHRHVDTAYLRRHLHKDQLSQVAGSKGGGYSTPFRRTCDAVRDFVASNPGCTLKAAIDGIKHHYSNVASARNNMRHWIEAGKVVGVSLEGGRLRSVQDPAAALRAV